MLVVTTKDHTFDLRWPGVHVVLHGPRRGDWWMTFRVAGSAEPARRYRVPEPRERIAVRVGGVAFAMLGGDRPGHGRRGQIALDLPRECAVTRRPREGRRAG